MMVNALSFLVYIQFSVWCRVLQSVFSWYSAVVYTIFVTRKLLYESSELRFTHVSQHIIWKIDRKGKVRYKGNNFVVV